MPTDRPKIKRCPKCRSPRLVADIRHANSYPLIQLTDGRWRRIYTSAEPEEMRITYRCYACKHSWMGLHGEYYPPGETLRVGEDPEVQAFDPSDED